MIKAILFDLDGVLVDMPDAHYEALNRALKIFGVTIGHEEHIEHFNGLPTLKKVEKLEQLKRLPPGLGEFINTLKQHYTKQIIPLYCQPDYSKIIMLKQLKDRKLLLGCCSNSSNETLPLMLQSARILEYFDLILGNKDICKPKPDPEIYLKAFEMLKVLPEECIIVEDAPRGIEAAKKSGAVTYEVRGIHDVHIDLFNGIL